MPGKVGATRPARAILNASHPHARGLVGWVLAEPALEILTQTRLVGTRDVIPHPTAGLMRRFDAAGEGVEVAVPPSLKVAVPYSVAVWYVPSATLQTAGGGLFGVVHNNADSAPYYSYEFSATDNGTNKSLDFGYDSGGVQSLSTGTLPVGVLTHVLAVVAAAGVTLYANGVSVATAGAASSPTYGATALLHAGNYTGVSRTPLSDFVEGRVWNRALSSSEARSLYDPATRWAIYKSSVVGL